MIKKIAAFLSPYISEETAIKGLKKISPKMGKFFAGATLAGYSTSQALDFLKQQNSPGKNQYQQNIKTSAQSGTARPDELMALQRMGQQDNPLVSPQTIPKMAATAGGAAALGKLAPFALEALSGMGGSQDQTQQQEQQKEKPNIIQQYSPELFEYLTNEIQNGRQPLEAGALAQMQTKFKNIIKKMADDHKTPFSSILQSVFGEVRQKSQQDIQQGQQGQTQGGNGNAILLNMLQSINQRLGGQ